MRRPHIKPWTGVRVGSRLGLIMMFAEIEGEAHNSLDQGGMAIRSATSQYFLAGGRDSIDIT
jgi:hypothetical protein